MKGGEPRRAGQTWIWHLPLAESFFVLIILAAYSWPASTFTHLRTTENAPLGQRSKEGEREPQGCIPRRPHSSRSCSVLGGSLPSGLLELLGAAGGTPRRQSRPGDPWEPLIVNR